MYGLALLCTFLGLHSVEMQITSNIHEAYKLETSDNWGSSVANGRKPLSNLPEIVARKEEQDRVLVTIKNSGNSTLLYYSAGRSNIQLWQETFEAEGWQSAKWDWCGTGKQTHKLMPGESVQLNVRFWARDKRERMLGSFSDESRNESSLIVLATESDGVAEPQMAK